MAAVQLKFLKSLIMKLFNNIMDIFQSNTFKLAWIIQCNAARFFHLYLKNPKKFNI